MSNGQWSQIFVKISSGIYISSDGGAVCSSDECISNY